MRAHIVEARGAGAAFAASEAEARQLRTTWMKSLGLPRKEITIEPIEIPTTKSELLKFLNEQILSRRP